jgi:hypothetical protein
MSNREILEELANGVASIEPAPAGKSYRRLVIKLVAARGILILVMGFSPAIFYPR